MGRQDVERVPAAVPAKAGIGFKLAHAQDLLTNPSSVGFVEIHAENFMGDGGAPHRILHEVRAKTPLSLHGVGLSIGAHQPLDKAHLGRFAELARRYEPGLVSEHLAWSTHEGAYFNDLLPLPYTEETLARVCEHIDEVQTALGRTMLLENPSSYFAFEEATMDEIEFISAIVSRTGCGLILDVNNVFVSATNLGSDANAYLDAFPLHAVGEIHLAGHADDRDASGATLLIDAHDREVADPVWTLYARTVAAIGKPVPTLIEWDNDVPAFDVLVAEARKAERVSAEALLERAA